MTGRTTRSHAALAGALGLASAIAGCEVPETETSDVSGQLSHAWTKGKHGKKKGTYGTAYNLSLQDTIRFEPIQPGADDDHGRELFGVASDLNSEDTTSAIFEGLSLASGVQIVSNGRTCFTCHRGTDHGFGMPPPPLSATVPTTDTLFTGIDADAQGDPRAAVLLEEHALFRYRPNRFNDAREQSDPLRQVFFWRKSPALLNVGLTHGFLMDGRGRTIRETDQGAVFSHTQDGDHRFDDLFSDADANDLAAFQIGLVSDPQLVALRDASHPLHQTLVDDPFYTVPIQTAAQERGREVFEKYCFSCHNMPNVFGNRDNVEALGPDGLSPQFPAHGPGVGRAFNIGIAERNLHGLSFTRHLGGGTFEPIVLPLAKDDGSTVMFVVDIDIGLAAVTQRYTDVGRFKVPQLRGLADNAPYFHDNSAATLEEVVDYFDSPTYNHSADGKRFPVHLTPAERSDLLELLAIL